MATTRKQQKEEMVNEILTGIVDRESKTYTFNKTMSVNGIKMEGTFVAKYMGISARLRLGTIRAKLLDGAPSESLDTLTDDIAYMIAYLTVALTKTPDWWNYDELDDVDELKSLYLEVYEFVNSFRQENAKSANA